MSAPTDFDVIIVGAGLSGIGAACQLSSENASYVVLEKRQALGGTWDVFRYPGIRSDSSMVTLGYSFNPWTGSNHIASGQEILDYLRTSAEQHGVDKHIRYGRRVLGASWSSSDERWTLTVEGPRGTTELTANFLLAGTGYYDNERGHRPAFPGEEGYAGEFVHPQTWGDTDVRGRNVAIIGSGATAITLLPELAKQAASVTMVQRSPTYVVALPKARAKGWAGSRMADIAATTFKYWFSRSFPETARRAILEEAQAALGPSVDASVHFSPHYDPWDQRICVAPDGDLFEVLRSGRASVVTGEIRSFEADGIRMVSGEHVSADLVVTATGLRLQFLGGIALHVDGQTLQPTDCALYRGMMLSGVPNLVLLTGYTNASWTLRAELSGKHFAQLFRQMKRRGLRTVQSPAPPSRLDGLSPLTSGYVKRGSDQLPLQGRKLPWKLSNYFIFDWLEHHLTSASRGLRFDQPAHVARKSDLEAA